MSENKKYTSDFAKVDATTDDKIDYSDSPETDDAFWKNTKIEFPTKKVRLSARIDADVMSWFRSQGKGYQTKINAILRSYMNAHSNS